MCTLYFICCLALYVTSVCRFEPAKCYYLDQLIEERATTTALATNSNPSEVEPMRQVSNSGMLKLKCGRNMYTYVPTFSDSNKVIKFDDADNCIVENKHFHSKFESDQEKNSSISGDYSSLMRESATQYKGHVQQCQEYDNAMRTHINNNSPDPPMGGGRRLGFHTSPKYVSTSNVTLNSTGKEISEKGGSTYYSGESTVNCGSNENIESAPHLEETSNIENDFDEISANVSDDSGDENPLCVEAWELDDQSLCAERNRLHKMLAEMTTHHGDTSEVDPISNSLQKSKGVDKVAPLCSNAAKLCSVKQPNLRFNPKAFHDINSKHYDERYQFELEEQEQALRDDKIATGAPINRVSAIQQVASSVATANNYFTNTSELRGIFMGSVSILGYLSLCLS